MTSQGPHAHAIRSIAAAGFYTVMSGAMAFINKVLVSNYAFNCPVFVLLIQMLILVLVFDTLRACRLVNVTHYSLSLGWSLMCPSALYITSSSLALLALSDLNIPMYNVIKRLCPLVNLVLGRCLLSSYTLSPRVVATVLLITCGSVMAGYGDLTFRWDGYLYGLGSTVAQALYLLQVQKSAKEDHLSALDISYVMSVNAFPLCLIALFLFGEVNKLMSFQMWHSAGFIGTFLSVTFSGTLLVYSQFLCTSVTSALTTSVSSSLKSVLTTIIGLFTFGGIHVTSLGALGIVLNTLGGVLYTYFKYLESSYASRKVANNNSSQLSKA